jgi:hypothetical protein
MDRLPYEIDLGEEYQCHQEDYEIAVNKLKNSQLPISEG